MIAKEAKWLAVAVRVPSSLRVTVLRHSHVLLGEIDPKHKLEMF